VLTASKGNILGQGVALVSSSVSLLHLRVTFHCNTLLHQSLNENCNILYSEPLLYGLYVCTCVFLLCQESFNMILLCNPSFYDGGVTIGEPKGGLNIPAERKKTKSNIPFSFFQSSF
jgi:hypothetical protein